MTRHLFRPTPLPQLPNMQRFPTLLALIGSLRPDVVGEEVEAEGASPAARVDDTPVEDEQSVPHVSTASQRRVLSAEVAFRAGLQSLDAIDLAATLRRRILTLQSVPVQMRSTLRTAFRAGLQLVADASSADSALRGWKLFYLAARMLLRRSRVPAAELDELFRWPCLLAAAEAAMRSSEPAATRTDRTDAEARAARATEFVHLGELSAAARALVSEPLAPGSPDTLRELRDPANRPQEPYMLPDPEVIAFRPADECALPLQPFLASLRRARRGTAAGPSGVTNEHLRILLDDEADCALLHGAAERLARADRAAAGCRCHPSGPYCRPPQAQRAGAGACSRGRVSPPGRAHPCAGVRVRAPSCLHAVSVWP